MNASSRTELGSRQFSSTLEQNYDGPVGLTNSIGFDPDCYRCAVSLKSELQSIETLLLLSQKCFSPKLRSYALELEARKQKLITEIESRGKEEACYGKPPNKRHRSPFVS